MKKPDHNSISVTLDSGKVVYITRTALANVESLLALQEKLVELYMECDTAIGSIITDDETVAVLTELCNLLPIKGTDETLNYDDIKENWEQTILLFFNGGLDVATREVTFDKILTASKVASLHFAPYRAYVKKYADQIQEREKAEKS